MLFLKALVASAVVLSVKAAPGSNLLTPRKAEQIDYAQICIDASFKNCIDVFGSNLPEPCTDLITYGDKWVNSLSSARPHAGIQCYFFTGTACSGASLLVTGEVPHFSTVGFQDIAQSYYCLST